MRTRHDLRARLRDGKGQSLVELAVVLPFLLFILCGLIEIGYLLVDQHVVTRLTREGSNLTSRNVTIEDAVEALTAMSAQPVDFNTRSKVIFSVLKRGAFDRIFLYQRHEHGTLSQRSQLTTRGSAVFGGAPHYEAASPDHNAGLQLTSVPANLQITRGGMMYVTEIYTRHDLLTPLGLWDVGVPTTLYSVAFF
jgi:hypothetical protein